MNDAKQMKILADQMWKYFDKKVEDKLQRNIRFFRAKVVSNPGSSKLVVQRPFDSTAITLPCVQAVSQATTGDQVVVFELGDLSNAIVVSDGAMQHAWNDGDYVTAGQKSGTTLASKATAEGNNTTASSFAAHAEGAVTIASGLESHAEGNHTTASGTASHAECNYTTASGTSSHAEGSYTTASGSVSHAEGTRTIANHKSQHVFGEYNTADDSAAAASDRGNYVEIVGNGTANDARSNARTLDWSGNEWIAGSLTQASDSRLKDVVGRDIPDVSSVRAVRFRWNDKNAARDDYEHIGYIAQDVEKVAPFMVFDDANGYKSLNYIALLCAKVDALEKKVAELENRQKGAN